MDWLHFLGCFGGGCFLVNAVPHFVSGVMGRPFQSPFATPRGVGLSSSTVNVIWGVVNLAVAYWLLRRLDPQATGDVAALGLGILLFGLVCARLFGRFHGGNNPPQGVSHSG